MASNRVFVSPRWKNVYEQITAVGLIFHYHFSPSKLKCAGSMLRQVVYLR